MTHDTFPILLYFLIFTINYNLIIEYIRKNFIPSKIIFLAFHFHDTHTVLIPHK